MLTRRSIMVLGMILLSVICAQAQKKNKTKAAPVTASASDSTKAKKPTIKQKTESARKIGGLLTLYQDTVTGSIQLYVRKDQLRKEFIYQSFSMGGPPELFLNQNMIRENWIFSIRKSFDKIEFLRGNTNYYYDPANAVSKAANVDVSETVFYSEKVVAEDESGYLIAADGLLISEKLDPVRPFLPPSIPPGAFLNLGNLNTGKSSYVKVRSYPKNTDVVVSLAYENPSPMNFGGKDITDARYVQVKMQHTFIEIPQNNYRPRFDDPRVGYFTQEVDNLTTAQIPNYRDLINRWNLEKKDADADLSEPVEPIVWWIENTTPVEIREVIMEAGLRWNEAFEYAGFKNAVVMKMMPDTASWDPADIRYNVIRWVSSDLGYAIGPSFVNPRTGQILGADITIDYGLLAGSMFDEETYSAFGQRDQLATLSPYLAKHAHCSIGEGLKGMQASAVTMLEAFEDDAAELNTLKNQFLSFLILHEMGHTMGLNHNMKSSNMLSPAELRNKEITRKFGVTGSVMDYPVANMTADRTKQGDYYTTKTGPYDWWAIEFGYRTFSPEKEKEGLNKILSRSNDPKLIFGNDADITGYGRGIDPRVMTWDMSSDMITYAEERFQMVNKTLTLLKSRFVKQGESYENLVRRYNAMQGQRYGMTAGVSRYIAGVFVDRSFPEQQSGSRPLTPVPSSYQKNAMALLSKYVFAPKAFDADASLFPYLQRQRRGFNFFSGTEDPKLQTRVLGIQQEALSHILHPTTLTRATNTLLYGNTYSPAEIMNDLIKACFNEDMSGSVNVYRQNLQNDVVNRLTEIANDNTRSYGNASRAAAYYQLKTLRSSLATAQAGDLQTKAHRSNLVYILDKSLSVNR